MAIPKTSDNSATFGKNVSTDEKKKVKKVTKFKAGSELAGNI